MKHGLAEVLHAAITDRDHEETYWPMVGALDQLLKACAAAGAFRADVDAEDVLLVFGFLWRIKPGPGSKPQARRLIDLLIDGLRAGGGASRRQFEKGFLKTRSPLESSFGSRKAGFAPTEEGQYLTGETKGRLSR